MGILKTLLVTQWLLTSSVLSDMDQLICDGVMLFNYYYEKQLLFGTLHEPINLVMHQNTGELFFSHKVRTGNAVHRKISVCDIDNRKCTDIEAVWEGRAIGYDRASDHIYFGGINGIYKYDRFTHSAHYFAAADKSIWTIFVQRYFYYVEAHSRRLYINVTGQFQIFPLMEGIEVDNFFVSTYNPMYFSNESGLYKAWTPTRGIYVLDNSREIRQITQNYYEEPAHVYFAVSDGIYVQSKTHYKLDMVALIPQIYGLTFRSVGGKDNYNVIYSDYEAIYSLVKSKNHHICSMQLHHEQKTIEPFSVDIDFDFNYY